MFGLTLGKATPKCVVLLSDFMTTTGLSIEVVSKAFLIYKYIKNQHYVRWFTFIIHVLQNYTYISTSLSQKQHIVRFSQKV